MSQTCINTPKFLEDPKIGEALGAEPILGSERNYGVFMQVRDNYLGRGEPNYVGRDVFRDRFTLNTMVGVA